MRVELQLDLETALALNQGTRAARGARVTRIRRAVKELGVTLTPVHPGQDHPLLAPFFAVEVPDEAAAARVVAALRDLDGVESAYVRPPDEPA
jgi:hypothetical protein